MAFALAFSCCAALGPPCEPTSARGLQEAAFELLAIEWEDVLHIAMLPADVDPRLDEVLRAEQESVPTKDAAAAPAKASATGGACSDSIEATTKSARPPAAQSPALALLANDGVVRAPAWSSSGIAMDGIGAARNDLEDDRLVAASVSASIAASRLAVPDVGGALLTLAEACAADHENDYTEPLVWYDIDLSGAEVVRVIGAGKSGSTKALSPGSAEVPAIEACTKSADVVTCTCNAPVDTPSAATSCALGPVVEAHDRPAVRVVATAVNPQTTPAAAVRVVGRPKGPAVSQLRGDANKSAACVVISKPAPGA